MPKMKQISPVLIERLMVFIDGGYLRETMRSLFGDDEIDWIALRDFFVKKFSEVGEPFHANLVRIYYYDGMVPSDDEDYRKQRRYFRKIRTKRQYTLRLGQAVRDGRGRLRQKGVDILLAIDALTKAYENHFDVAIFLTGDRDFLPIVRAVKDTGKKIFGFYQKKTTPLDLRVEFDVRYSIKKNDFEHFAKVS